MHFTATTVRWRPHLNYNTSNSVCVALGECARVSSRGEHFDMFLRRENSQGCACLERLCVTEFIKKNKHF